MVYWQKYGTVELVWFLKICQKSSSRSTCTFFSSENPESEKSEQFVLEPPRLPDARPFSHSAFPGEFSLSKSSFLSNVCGVATNTAWTFKTSVSFIYGPDFILSSSLLILWRRRPSFIVFRFFSFPLVFGGFLIVAAVRDFRVFWFTGDALSAHLWRLIVIIKMGRVWDFSMFAHHCVYAALRKCRRLWTPLGGWWKCRGTGVVRIFLYTQTIIIFYSRDLISGF